MARSIFGGDPGKSHYCARVWIDQKLPAVERRELYRVAKRKLAEHGFKAEKYFEYLNRVGPQAKARAESYAHSYASVVEQRTGVKLEVHEGFFL